MDAERQRWRPAIAMQVARQLGLLLMDEPLAGLDWKTKQSLVPALRNLANQKTSTGDGEGCGVLIVTHEIDELRDGVDSWWQLDGGSVKRVLPTSPSSSSSTSSSSYDL